MLRYEVHVAPRAQSQIDEVTAWWRGNRPAASTLVSCREFATTPITRSTRQHESCASWPSGTRQDGVDGGCESIPGIEFAIGMRLVCIRTGRSRSASGGHFGPGK